MKKNIGLKIIFTYLIILLVSFGVAGFLFNSLVRSFLVREVQSSLQKEGAVLAALYKKSSLEGTIREIAGKKLTVRLVNRLFEGNYALVDRQKKVVFSNRPRIISAGTVINSPGLNQALKGNNARGVFLLKDRDFVNVSMPLRDSRDNIDGALVVYTELRGVQRLGTAIFWVLMQALLIVSLLTVVPVVLLARSISRPVKELEAGARRLAARDFDTKISIHTGDEVEQLGISFNTMARELKNYYLAQKRFLQNASHELKTPLMSIQGYAEGIRDGVLEEEEKEKGLGIIIEESKRLKDLVNELIYLSKLETMEEVYYFEEYELGEILRESSDRVESLARQKDIQINLQVPDNPVVVRVDREKVARAFINLFSNAIRFAESRVDVRLKNDTGKVHIKFTDDGPGLEDKALDSIFDRFYIGHKGETGLGLAITKAIVEKHGGSIDAGNNHPGAAFTVILPGPK